MPTTPPETLQQAMTHARLGHLAEAEELCEHLLAQPVVESETRHLLGVIRNIQGRFAEAEPLLRQAVAEQPGVAKYHSNLGNALRGLQRFEEAESCYRRALAIDPAFDDARSNLAQILYVQKRWDDAITEYRQLLHNNPQDLISRVSLASLLQSANHLDEAEEIATTGLKYEPDNPGLNLVMGICERRTGKFEQALQRLHAIDPTKLDTRLAASLHYERGLLYDRLDQVEPAFADFSEGNRLQAQDAQRRGIDKTRYLSLLDRLANLDMTWLRKPSTTPAPAPSPVFLVGFPRSGTTLLDQILDSHPRIETMEEKPVVAALCDDIDSLIRGKAGSLDAIDPIQLAMLRQDYFEYVAEFIELEPGNLLVDKLPLNITRVPYILRVFPDARFILALRHPCGCVLSCFMHLFEPNDAMANFYTLQDAAALYARIMGLWRHWAEISPLRHHRVYYEHLVQDLPGEIKPLLDFLGVEWHEAMARPHEHAARRGHIDTPSHSQVIQPIYQRAAGRWRRYQHYLNPIMETLQPYIEYFGYDSQGNAE